MFTMSGSYQTLVACYITPTSVNQRISSEDWQQVGSLTVSTARVLRGEGQQREMTSSNVEFVLPKSRHIPPPVSPLFSKSEGSSPGIDVNQKFFRSHQSSENSRYSRKTR